jgi:molybdate transport system substrate-binding protein
MSRWIATIALLVTAACGTSGVGDHPPRLSGSITVFAAASLTEAFRATGDSFSKAYPGTTVRFSFAGTPTLRTQIEQGAHADVFASADMDNMAALVTDGLTATDVQVFAHNRLEIVVAPGNPKKIASLADLARPEVIFITEALTVPAGKYSREALAKAGVSPKPKSLEADVKSVVSKIELGEADAGIVYATDVKAAGDKVTGVPIPEQYNVEATYPIVMVKGTANPNLASAFVWYLVFGEGQSKLESFGFQHA